MQRFVYFHAQFSPWVDLGRRALLALAKEKKNLQDMHGRYLLCKSHWVPGLKSCWNSQCARWKKVVLLDDVDAQFSPWKFKFLPTKKIWIWILSILSTKNSQYFLKHFFNLQLWIFLVVLNFGAKRCNEIQKKNLKITENRENLKIPEFLKIWYFW